MHIENLPNEFIIFDTEYTAWEGSQKRGWSGEGEYKELVQLGAIRVSEFKETESLLIYVRPEKNPVLSEYFTELTKITQKDIVEKGVSFKEARDRFVLWSRDSYIYSYGNDVDILLGNELLQGLHSTIRSEYFRDVRNVFSAHGIPAGDYSSGTIPRAFGLTPPPSAHDALNDARSINMALTELSRK